MQRIGRFLVLSALIAALIPLPAVSQTNASSVATLTAAGDRLFRTGDFVAAATQYQRAVEQDPKAYRAVVQLGAIALLGNRLDEAIHRFDAARRLRPGGADPQVMLAEAYYRRDDFRHAVSALAGVDVAANELVRTQYPTLGVAKLRSFAGQTPYALTGSGDRVRVPFVRTDPLPLVNVRVNGGRTVTFFIDTGGSEVVLDTAFARELGVPRFGSVQGTFSGGQTAPVVQSRIDSLSLGTWTIHNLPAVMLPLRQLSPYLKAKQIDGIIGTTLFAHFLTTLDYRRGELVLRKKDRNAPDTAGAVSMPFWIAGDHFMVGWGRVQQLPRSLLFVDTGLQGAGAKLAESVIKAAGIRLDETKATAGAGGGGTLRIVPYVVKQLAFGDVREEDVDGLYDGPFPWENRFGFHLAGMVGHDFFRPYAVTFDFTTMTIVVK